MTNRARFRIARFAIPLVVLTLLAAWSALAPALSHVSVHEPPTVAEQDWGQLRAYDGALMFVLGPVADARRRYELGLAHVMFASAGVVVADDEQMTNAVALQGEPMGKCGFHWQGRGVNVIVAIGRCVPGWAGVTGASGHARQWVRVENLLPRGRVVVVKYG